MNALSKTPPRTGRADLHVHSTCSDGLYTPAQVVDLARRCGLAAVALTDHDTLDGIAPALLAAQGRIEVVPALELTAHYEQQPIHILGYFVRVTEPSLLACVQRLKQARQERFFTMVERLRACGVSLDDIVVRNCAQRGMSGRRHLAELLVQTRHVSTTREAFARYLHDRGSVVVPLLSLSVADAITVIRGSGGVAVWAHPAYDGVQRLGPTFRQFGLQGLEVEYPSFRPQRVHQLRQWAAALNLLVTGGSDCHGPEPSGTQIGARSVTWAELELIRQAAR